MTGSLVFAAAGTWLLLVPGTQPAYLSQWLPAMLLSGVGIGMVLPSLSGAAVAGLAPARFAVGGAVNQAIRQFGAVLGVALTVRWLGGAELAPADFGPVFGMQIALASHCARRESAKTEAARKAAKETRRSATPAPPDADPAMP